MKEKEIIKLRSKCVDIAVRIAPNTSNSETNGGVLIGAINSSKDVDKVIEIASVLYNWINNSN